MNIAVSSPPVAVRLRDPASHLTEVMFGLITILIFTLAAGDLVQPGATGARQMLFATIICALGWSVIDGVMFVVHNLVRRGRVARFVQEYRIRPDEDYALNAIEKELDATLASLVTETVRGRYYWQILASIAAAEPQKVRIEREDLFGGLTSALLVFCAIIPAALPFLWMSDVPAALRVSNGVVVGLLCINGYVWARYTSASRWLTVSLFAFLSVGMIVAATRLGS
ncbi:hypothetical protein DB347_15525 [Opitutaceae bacterium EW11]|nr:hypothetical protein DB347_15525 [Opitutaceae bacterium EW11]